jgi:dTDP-4-dehydrorhamnose reductase
MNATTTVLVTGASGLLGSALVRQLQQDGLAVMGLCNRNPMPGLIPVDLMNRDAVLDLARLKWDAIINCAAFRSPDYCEKNPEPASVLNARMPEWLAGMAAARNAPFIHISTDYVFPGEAPPYSEASPVAPVNVYGRTKVDAENAVRLAHPHALVVRIPALYGRPAPPVFSTLLQEGVDDARGRGPLALDDVTVRYPTPVEDVSRVLSKALTGGVEGVLQVSSGERATRYHWTCRICAWLGLDASRLSPGPQAVRPARRPVDCHLSTVRLESLGLPVPRPFGAVLPELLKELDL